MDYKKLLAAALAQGAGMPENEIANMLEIPPDKNMGDFALPCFKLARVLRKAPPMIAQELSSLSMPDCVERVEVAGGYLNFFMDKTAFAKATLEANTIIHRDSCNFTFV